MRSLYCWLLSLHPKPFRDRFEPEMHLVFDDTAANGSILWLFGDLLRSLFRQWIFRSHAPVGGHTALSSGTPLFASIETAAWPRPWALICGGVLSAVMMAGIFGISRGGATVSTARYGFAGTALTHSTWGWKVKDSGPLDSPAGQRLRQWLDAYNTGDEKVIRRFAVTYVETPVNDPYAVERKTQTWMSLFHHFGPFQLESVHQGQSDQISSTTRLKTGERWSIEVRVSPDERHAIREMTTQFLPEPRSK